MIEEILDKSETPPIIVLQGDHGLRLTWWDNRQLPDDKIQLEKVCQREVFSILNALYLQDSKGRAAFYDSLSPVNTFRLIFDAYFGGELGVLDDRSFFSTLNEENRTVSFIEVTGSQESCNPVWERRFSN